MGIWVRPQDKKTLIFLHHIYLDSPVNGIQLCGISGIDSFVVLGKYSTEKHAIEVLDEIQDFIRNYEYSKISSECNTINPIFQMPAE